MNEIELVVAALGAGAAAGLSDSVSSAVRDAYEKLRIAVQRRLDSREGQDIELPVMGVESEIDDEALREALAMSGADRDGQVQAAAEAFLRELNGSGPRAGIGMVRVHDSQGVHTGQGPQINFFNAGGASGGTPRD
ncbi:hypothetical protein ACQF36_28710 [Streptomyces sp. Marseille-Q5077]|uniref:hypothetical protein n=1 Tax=Streptomyces sp. Marseille-Q5077 TaxID=3418995 RepID=UPI003CFC6A9A